MARTLKKGLDFFHFDTSFFDDIKIRKLIRYHGAQAVVVYQLVLIRIYHEGYYLQWDDDLPFIVAEVSHLQDDYVKTVIFYCIEIGLFDKTLFDSNHVLTSKGIQNRFFDFCVVAKRKIATENPYLLVDLSSKAIKTSSKSISSEEKGINSEEITINPEEIENSSEETGFNSKFSTQSKVKESKDNNSLRSSLSPSTTPSPARECEGEQEEMEDIPMLAKEGVELLKKDRDWLLQMQRKFGVKASMLVRWLDSFSVDCDCRGKQEHDSLADVKQHFNDWMTKQKPKRTAGKKGGIEDTSSLTSQQLWIKCQAELCHAVSPEVSHLSFDVIRFESFNKSTSELFIQVPSKDTYEYMEQNLVQVMSSIIPKYFGANFKLKYRLP